MSHDFEISVANEQSQHPVDEQRLCEAARLVLLDSHFTSATLSIAVVDDAAMHELNRRYLNHDWPTDVLSFALFEEDNHLEGEVILSADTASAAAAEAAWPAAAEQLLYVIHGTLHLVGYRDKTPADAHKMRAAEATYLRQLGFHLARPDGDRAGSVDAGIGGITGGTRSR
jgi:probable rRNA maturation factor